MPVVTGGNSILCSNGERHLDELVHVGKASIVAAVDTLQVVFKA